MSTILVRVEAGDWLGAMMLEDETVFAASDFLRWTIGMNSDELRRDFARRGWKATIVRDKRPDPVVEG
jgi:hypothetical protein